jgi:hypothetical protein
MFLTFISKNKCQNILGLNPSVSKLGSARCSAVVVNPKLFIYNLEHIGLIYYY